MVVAAASFAFVYCTHWVKTVRFRERKGVGKALEWLRVVSGGLALVCCAVDKSYASASDTDADCYVRSVLSTYGPF